MTKIGVRYCGGCNPRYDRRNVFETVKGRFPAMYLENAKEGVLYDALLVICGCTSCCTSYQQFDSKYGAILVRAQEDIDKVLEFLEKLTEVK